MKCEQLIQSMLVTFLLSMTFVSAQAQISEDADTEASVDSAPDDQISGPVQEESNCKLLTLKRGKGETLSLDEATRLLMCFDNPLEFGDDWEGFMASQPPADSFGDPNNFAPWLTLEELNV
ncbi:hypothetical protein [uncultured Ruegeria sp.]|uniref:hypothetical protein n=1 Tax=uncultured Ruegeria sp. TaxID=259304 RepID=UPI00262E71FF|nr:hypothetical protein [uncultured Ruegeria sp.]